MGKKVYEACDEYRKTVRTEYFFHCPGCGRGHSFITAWVPPHTGPTWTFNGNLESPTFSPSLLYNVGRSNPTEHLCHTFVRAAASRLLHTTIRWRSPEARRTRTPLFER